MKKKKKRRQTFGTWYRRNICGSTHKKKQKSLKKHEFKDNFKTFKEADIFRRPSIKFFFYSNKIDILLSFKSSFTQLYTILHIWKIDVQNSNKYLIPLC